MKKILLSFGGLLVLVLLIGQGCANMPGEANTVPDTKDAMMDNSDNGAMKDDTMKNGDAMEKTVTDFRLRAEATGNRTVRFEWDVPEDVAKNAEGYRFSRGLSENPDVNKDGWWWERGPAHRELDWEGLPTGPAHFRVCVLKDDTCDAYSNDVEVNVK